MRKGIGGGATDAPSPQANPRKMSITRERGCQSASILFSEQNSCHDSEPSW